MNAAIKTRLGPRLYTAAILAVLLGVSVAWSQDPPVEEPAETGMQAEAAAGDPENEADAGAAGDSSAAQGPADEDESILDDQTFEGDDEDFIPTEEVPVDEAIPFPTDI